MTDEISTVSALLHDVIEDSEYTLDKLRALGFPAEVLEVLSLLTHDAGVSYMEYVEKINTHPVARRVKLADLYHNSDLSRMDVIDEYALERTEKYRRAIELLSGGES